MARWRRARHHWLGTRWQCLALSSLSRAQGRWRMDDRSAQPRALLAAIALLLAIAHVPLGAQATTPAFVLSPDGVRIAYETHGSGDANAPALIFVHGWSCDRSYWKNQL